MTRFTELEKIIPFTHDAFETFYRTLLKDIRLSIFFESQAQISTLIETQKRYFIDSLTMTPRQMSETYTRLGELHYGLKIPYIDFIKGAEILQEHFILSTYKVYGTEGLMAEIFDYFKIMKSFTAKGYLNVMLEDDLKDIDSFSENIKAIDQAYLPNKITLNKLTWLKGLLGAIRDDTDWCEETRRYFEGWKKELDFVPESKRDFFLRMEERILFDTQNLFYFLKKHEYTEILPLYTSLLNIYKLSLMMNNALTIEYANRVIDDMKLDQLTLLFRKEMFETMVVKEMAMAARDPQYGFSVAFFDLDDFKLVNDAHGHFCGDRVLEVLGKTIRKHTRLEDMAFRIGGDEVAILLKNADAAAARRICERIKDEFTRYDFGNEACVPFSASVSIGINEYRHGDRKPFEIFFKELDRNLYTAKNAGKNRIVS